VRDFGFIRRRSVSESIRLTEYCPCGILTGLRNMNSIIPKCPLAHSLPQVAGDKSFPTRRKSLAAGDRVSPCGDFMNDMSFALSPCGDLMIGMSFVKSTAGDLTVDMSFAKSTAVDAMFDMSFALSPHGDFKNHMSFTLSPLRESLSPLATGFPHSGKPCRKSREGQ
jgi:hypothetical protein